MTTIYLTPEGSLKDGIIGQIQIDETTEIRISYVNKDKKYHPTYGMEGISWHASLDAAKEYVEKCRQQEIEHFQWLINRLKNLKTTLSPL